MKAPEQRLAVQVINKAVDDFVAGGLGGTPCESSRSFQRLEGNRYRYRLAVVRDKIAAGEFLLERMDDPLKRLFFQLADIRLEAPLGNRSWVERLAGLRGAGQGLLRGVTARGA